MRKIRCYDQLSVYAQRMLDIMHDPGWYGLEYDIWENDSGCVIYDGECYTMYYSINEADKALSKMLIDFVTDEIKALDDIEDISNVAKLLVLE